jgi:hypothetical protein
MNQAQLKQILFVIKELELATTIDVTDDISKKCPLCYHRLSLSESAEKCIGHDESCEVPYIIDMLEKLIEKESKI